ncbi:MAG TPA: helix-turn-helix transcriptional regulator [Pseudonocardiaceae bacterium]|nr:helix-turn-helix transcriptional regulator [Pseudonocardiaceae bacterium]
MQRRRLRVELRRARDVAGLRQADVAHAMEWSPSKLIRIERGDVSVSTNDLRALLNHYGVKDKGKVNELLELARSARGASFYDQYADLLKPGFKEYLAYEASASVIRQYDPILVPGLLQIEEYARGLFEGVGKYEPERADKLWALRQQRQEVHDRESPPEMLFILDEAALRRQVGRGQAMRHQLERIKEAAADPHISIQIMPFTRGAHPGMDGNFILIEFTDPNLDDLVHLESINQITIRDDTELIAKYLDRFVQLEELALTPDESVDFLDVLISDMSSTDQPTNSAEKEAV